MDRWLIPKGCHGCRFLSLVERVAHPCLRRTHTREGNYAKFFALRQQCLFIIFTWLNLISFMCNYETTKIPSLVFYVYIESVIPAAFRQCYKAKGLRHASKWCNTITWFHCTDKLMIWLDSIAFPPLHNLFVFRLPFCLLLRIDRCPGCTICVFLKTIQLVYPLF